MHTLHFKEGLDDDIEELPFESFIDTLKKLRKKPGGKYQFLTSVRAVLRMKLYKLFQEIWKTEKIPSLWREFTITQLRKGNIVHGDLTCMRNRVCQEMENLKSKILPMISSCLWAKIFRINRKKIILNRFTYALFNIFADHHPYKR